MYLFFEAIIAWNTMDTETKTLVTIAAILSMAVFWLIIRTAMASAIEEALKNRARNQSNLELALQIRDLEKQIAELQKQIPKEQ